MKQQFFNISSHFLGFHPLPHFAPKYQPLKGGVIIPWAKSLMSDEF
jgi:hypothetical protein